ncbi:MAG: hypothetical protein NW215_04655 [Hyphomicrobiales bacterium]|nr:hypothetical protein [Hyphomicrobiales bacterium]
MKLKSAFAAAGVIAIGLSGCGSPTATEASLVPNMTVPAGGITPVKDVVMTPREGDTIELTAAANSTFKFEQLEAVMWCRASQHAKANKFADWEPLKSEPLRAATPETPMIGRSLVRMVRVAPPAAPGAKKPVKDWCKNAPKAALA